LSLEIKETTGPSSPAEAVDALPRTRTSEADSSSGEERLYTARFFQVFAAVALFMTGFALQFHFGQYVGYLGHGEDVLGRILGAGMIGVLLIRLQIGRWIDHFGCKPTWIIGTSIAAVTAVAIQFVTDVWLIAIIRGAYMMAFAAVMTTVAVFAAQIAPPHRRAECLGTIGMAGFSGMLLGPTIGDWIFAAGVDTMGPYRIFFTLSAACSVGAGLIMLGVRVPARPLAHERPEVSWRVMRAHSWVPILLIAMAFSMVFCINMTFLERMAEVRGFKDIKLFFLVYAPTAMMLRILLRRMPERFGRQRTIVLGMFFSTLGVLCLSQVTTAWQLVLPGVLMGIGHCFVFPSMVDLAASQFPESQRGTGTSVIMGAGDIGMLLGFFVLGELIDGFGYGAAFAVLAGVVLLAGGVLAVSNRPALHSHKPVR